MEVSETNLRDGVHLLARPPEQAAAVPIPVMSTGHQELHFLFLAG